MYNAVVSLGIEGIKPWHPMSGCAKIISKIKETLLP
jgi:hypothetical protein